MLSFENFLLFAAFDQGLGPLIGEASPELGASQQNFRQKIKKQIGDAPYSSISHAPDLGGFVGLTNVHDPLLQVGFDIEALERVEDSVVERVRNSKDEIPGFSDVAALRWSAKEAAFKSLAGDCQPQVVSQVILQDWIQREHNITQFTFRTGFTSAGTGYAWDDGTHQFAIAFWTPDSQTETGCRS